MKDTGKLVVKLLTAGLAVLAAMPGKTQVLLQGFYWDVPSPAAGAASAPWWWDHLAKQAPGLHSAGFTAVWIPPVTKGASGGYSVGYDPFDDYDLGSKNRRAKQHPPVMAAGSNWSGVQQP